jgi:NO-binding membrane sensor protein with MHYT domain
MMILVSACSTNGQPSRLTSQRYWAKCPIEPSHGCGISSFLSLVIAIAAATAALWAAVRLEGIRPTFIASLIMGFAVSSMHYVGMAAMHVFRSAGPAGMIMGGPGGATAESFLLPLILGITVVSFALTATMALSASADELRYDAALMDRIKSTRAGL